MCILCVMAQEATVQAMSVLPNEVTQTLFTSSILSSARSTFTTNSPFILTIVGASVVAGMALINSFHSSSDNSSQIDGVDQNHTTPS